MIYTLPFELTGIQGDGFHPFVEIKLGRKKLRMLIDTGASRTVFDESRLSLILAPGSFEPIEQLSAGLGTNSVQGKSTIIESLRLADLRIRKYQAIILDLSHVNELYHSLGMPLLDGVLGSDLFVKYRASIDFAARQLVLKSTNHK
jgi:predicted aspartyl protease